jgi:hypothetical protein
MLAELTGVCSDGRCALTSRICAASKLLTAVASEHEGILEVPLPDFDVATVGHAIDFLDHHESEPFADLEPPLRQPFDAVVSSWDKSFVATLQQKGATGLLALLSLACYLDIGTLRALCSAAIAAMLQGVADNDIHSLFGVEAMDDDATTTACREYPWLLE